MQTKGLVYHFLVSAKFVCPQLWGRKWLRQFYGRLEKCVLSAGKPHAHKIPRFREGECRFYFYGREDFSDIYRLLYQAQGWRETLSSGGKPVGSITWPYFGQSRVNNLAMVGSITWPSFFEPIKIGVLGDFLVHSFQGVVQN